MSITATPTARDIIFEFPNSCNSTCCIPERRIYVNSAGSLENYKHRKARLNTQKAFERSLGHLNQTLERKVRAFEGDPQEFQNRICSIVDSIEIIKEINLSHIEAINTLMLDYFAEKSPRLETKPALEKEEEKEENERGQSCLIL